MKCIVISLLIVLAGSARLEAHAFLKTRNRVWAARCRPRLTRFEFGLRKTSNLPLAESKCSTRPARKWTNVICIWIAQTNRYCTFLFHRSKRELARSVWRVLSVDTHVTKGDFTFRVVR